MSYAQQYSSQRIDESAAESDAAEEAEAGGSLRPQESTNMASPSPSPKSSSRRWNLGGSAEETSLDTSAVTPANLYLWLRRCSRKFNRGVTVIKVLPNGKIVRRQLFIGAKPEYIELTSTKLFDIAYHLGDIESISQGIQSAEFGALLVLNDVRRWGV
eukprot:Gregarina_sp_Pseudo_9__2553@NODE_2821_length_859_cov_139_902439_g2492_i1_p1_GENE_NODE_2821_length_859_cov_139_902439_g2492_i1NODE_2821_length_859_cov_139_902439_g2492_i1_p1_ORF_typecomplete_len158_score41_05SRPalpha_N/PF04086_13/0_13_NODE_2821_length_859_cov_139_902439_g2492_i175548